MEKTDPKKQEKNDILWRVYLVYLFTVVFALLILGRVIHLQFIDGDRWREKARNETLRYINIDAVRGDILADDGRLLATSVPVYEIRIDLSRKVVSDEVLFAGIDSLALRLSRLFRDKSQSEYKRMILKARSEQDQFFLLRRNVNYHQLVELKTFPVLRLGRYRGGLRVIERSRRETPFKTLASRTIGYEREGVYVGLEGAYREFLEGTQGQRLMQRISGGWMPINDEDEIQPVNGKDVITTININIQDVAENALQKQLQRYNATHGTVVVMEVATGKVKAISNLTRNGAGNYEEVFNYAIGESAEPGSTFKLASLIALLEDGIVKPDEFVQTGNGRTLFADRLMRDAKDGGFGTITFSEVFALSSNVGFSTLVNKAYSRNPSRFISHLENLMIDKPLGIEIKGEGIPKVPRPGEAGWSGVTLPWLSIGYGVSLTPLQMLSLYNAIANDGKYMKPMFVEEVRQTGKLVKRFEPQVVKRAICSKPTLEKVKAMLELVVESGTASGINTQVYRIAGKTGTAQYTSSSGGYKSSERMIYRASFAGYFPADNPIYSMIVVIHDPKGWVYSGSQVAAPVFREIADKIYATQINVNENYLHGATMTMLPDVVAGSVDDLRRIYSIFNCRFRLAEKGAQWATARVSGQDTVQATSREFIHNLVPNVVGMGLSDALFLLENAGLRVRISGRGAVRSQSIRPGTRTVPGSEIVIQLS